MIHENIEKIKGSSQYFSLMAILGIAVLVCSVSPALAVTSPTLGNAGSFAILGPETVTNAGPTVVIGDLGVSPGTAFTGFPPGKVISGTIHAGDATAAAAQVDNTAAFGVLDQICTTTYTGVQDLTLVSPLGPGVYCADAFILTGNLDLNGTGVWIFKSASTLITSPGSSVTGGDPCNVWWRIGSSATLDTTTKFEGNILALASISLRTGATLDGRALAQTAAVTMDSNKISPSICGVPNALKLTKTGMYDQQGQTIAYDYRLQNTGTDVLDGPFTVSDDKVTVTCPGTPTSLNPGESIICSASYSVIQADLDAGSITNNATATGESVTSNQEQVTVTTVALETKALTLNKTASPATYDQVGQTITYSYELKNTGNVVLNGPFKVSDDKVTVTCPTDLTLNPGESIICSASHNVTQADLDAGSITNTANATAENNAVTSNQGQVTVTTVAQETKALTLNKTASLGTYDHIGQTITYAYELKNTGNVVLNGPFNVSDDKVTVTCPTDLTLNPGESIICSASHNVTQADLDAGSITNTANATAENNAVTSNRGQVTVTKQGSQSIPEFSIILLPVISVIGLLYLLYRRNGK